MPNLGDFLVQTVLATFLAKFGNVLFLKRFSRLKHFTYRIVGGQEAKIGKYPWLANLGFQLAGKGNVEFKVRLRYDDCMAGLQYSRIGFDQTGD